MEMDAESSDFPGRTLREYCMDCLSNTIPSPGAISTGITSQSGSGCTG